MGGWFPENEDERRRRIAREDRISEENAIARRKKIELRKKQKAEFQKKIDSEVERHLEELTPEAKRERLEKLHGSSSLLNGALGLEFAAKGQRTATPWLNSYSKSSYASNQKNSEEVKKEAAPAPVPGKIIRLTRPF